MPAPDCRLFAVFLTKKRGLPFPPAEQEDYGGRLRTPIPSK
jgi:hypothetical protein